MKKILFCTLMVMSLFFTTLASAEIELPIPNGTDDIPGFHLNNEEGISPDLEGMELMPYIPNDDFSPDYDGESTDDFLMDYEIRYTYDEDGNVIGVTHILYYANGYAKIVRVRFHYDEAGNIIYDLWFYFTFWYWENGFPTPSGTIYPWSLAPSKLC